MASFQSNLSSTSNGNGISISRNRKSRQQAIEEIETSVAHKVQLQQWQNEETLLKSRIERKELKYSTAQNDIYQLLGMFFVFQGVIFTAVAQAQKLTCQQWWSPFALSLLVSLAAFCGLLQKLAARRKFQRQLLMDKRQARVLFRFIRALKDQGSSFDLDSDPGRSTQQFNKSQRQLSVANRLRRIAKIYVFCYGAAVTSFVAFFSVIILVSCVKILCDQ